MPQILTAALWISVTSLTGFLISGIFSGYLKWNRRKFLFPYIIFSILLIYIFFKSFPVTEDFWVHNWLKGLIAYALIGAFLVRNVWSQPFTRKENDNMFLPDLIWYGLAYGVTDGLLLNVLPVAAVSGVITITAVSAPLSKVLAGIIGITASLAVTLFYHLGYTEFRNRSVLKVLLGNAVITFAYIISGNPLAAVLSHATMHIAAVLRGPETTIQLPPHYR